MPRIAGIIARCGPENMTKPVAKTSGTIAPPTKPWMARKTIIDSMSHASPHSALASVNKKAEATNNQRVDSA